jgi:hypothetical protein
MKDNNEIFLEFWQHYQWPPEPQLYFRLYHDEHGRPLAYSRHDQPGTFIDVSPEEFAIGRMDVMVKDGRLVYPSRPRAPCLRPGPKGTACHRHDVTVVVHTDSDHVKWSVENHDD